MTSNPPDEGYSNLEEMKSRYMELLTAETPAADAEIQTFLRKGVNLGKTLSFPAYRAEAQSMLNYWAASISASRPAAERVESAGLEAIHADKAETFGVSGFVVLQPYDEGSVIPALQQGLEKIGKGTPEEVEDVKRLLPYLVEMDGTGTQMALSTISENDEFMRPAGKERPGLALLRKAGLLTTITVEDGTKADILSTELLMAKWPLLANYCKSRRSFRELARGWSRGGKSNAALLGPRVGTATLAAAQLQQKLPWLAKRIPRWGPVFQLVSFPTDGETSAAALLEHGEEIRNADLYRDRMPIEDEFIRESRKAAESLSKGKLKTLEKAILALSAMLLMMMALLGIIIYLWISGAGKDHTIEIQFGQIKEKNDKIDSQKSTIDENHDEDLSDQIVSEKKDHAAKIGAHIIVSNSAKLDEILRGNPEAKKIVEEIKQSAQALAPEELPPAVTQGEWQTGKAAVFNPETDPETKPTDTLALVFKWSEADAMQPQVFKTVPPAERGPRPLVVQLDPNASYIAARWDYKVTPRKWLLAHKVRVKNPANGRMEEAQPVDWGPGYSVGLIHISPGLAAKLGLPPEGGEASFSFSTPPPAPPAPAPPSTPAPGN